MRSFQTNARNRSLTTGTFNRVVKDRIAFRLSGANSVQPETHKCDPDRPRNLTTIRCGEKPCQRPYPTEFPPVFHIGKAVSGRRSGSSDRWARAVLDWRTRRPPLHVPLSSKQRATVWPSASKAPDFGARRSGRQKIEKRTYFGGPCFEGTLQKPTVVSESCPVAGTISRGLTPSTI